MCKKLFDLWALEDHTLKVFVKCMNEVPVRLQEIGAMIVIALFDKNW